jgi:hypothetical protein
MLLMRLHCAAGIVCAAVIFSVTGCSGSGGSGTISGTVTVDGQKLKRGLITFMPENTKKGVFNAAIVEGKFEISGVPTGLAKVVVMPGMDPPGSGDNPADGNDRARPNTTPKMETLATSVPVKYQSAATSGLELTVKSGPNPYDLNLTP